MQVCVCTCEREIEGSAIKTQTVRGVFILPVSVSEGRWRILDIYYDFLSERDMIMIFFFFVNHHKSPNLYIRMNIYELYLVPALLIHDLY